MKIFELCKLAEVGAGTAKQIELREASPEPFALFNVEGGLHLTEDTCTHAFASLSQGEIQGNLVCRAVPADQFAAWLAQREVPLHARR